MAAGKENVDPVPSEDTAITVLGRCISCFKGKRGAEYCRILRHHSDERASVCLNCEQEGNSLTTCRQILHHNDCNAFQWKTFASTKKQLPSCCLELLGLQTQYYLAGDKEGQVKEPYVTGYMVPYSENLWKDWLKRFTLQSGCEYTIRTGVQKNEESRERGAIKLQGKLCSYTSTWTRTYTCLRGGEGKFKPLKLSKKNRCSIGSRRYGCKAVLHIRLLTISDGSTALEIKVPTIDAHLPTHNPSSITDQMCLKPLPELESKVLELVQESLLGQRALRMSLKTWVERELIPRHIQDGVIDEQPSQYNRAYYPNAEDIRVMVKKAITQERSSLFDQGAVLQLLQEEKETHQLKFFFRQYSKDESQDKQLAEIDQAVNVLKTVEKSDSILNFSKEESFLLVYQTKLQSDWLQRFGNTITCMDAVYKTLRYGFPCFFLVIKISIGIGKVVATIIPQFETEELIAEGLRVIKSWNPLWTPKYFMTDKSAQELGAISLVHPECNRLICDFHSLQAIERWTNRSQNGVRHDDQPIVKALFKQLLYANSEEKFQTILSQIQTSEWYKKTPQLQAYLGEEWLKCKVLWSHIYRQDFHAGVNTDNFVESFNNVLKNHYLTLRHDKSVYSLTKILLHCVFPDQEREYVVQTARQTSIYRKPRKDLPPFLQNRPTKIQNACLASMEKAKLISSTAISETLSSSGKFKVKSGNETYDVKIIDGSCSCPYFCQEGIPCKHMFSIFNHYAWNWSDLPVALTQSAYMTLETDLLETNQLSCQELDNFDGNEMEVSSTTPAQEIPLYQPQGTRLLGLQKKNRDTLAKCSAAVFMVDDIDVLEQLNVKISEIYKDLVQTVSINNSTGDMPIIKQLMADEISQYKRKIYLSARANQLTRKYRVMAARKRRTTKVTRLPQKLKRLQDDPLNLATRPSVGRPKGKKKNKQSDQIVDTVLRPSTAENKPALKPKAQRMQGTQQTTIQNKTISKLKATKLNGRKGRCGQCSACRAPDCGKCRYCLDKKKFGGPERLKKCCIHRKCKSLEQQSNQSNTANSVNLIIDKLRQQSSALVKKTNFSLTREEIMKAVHTSPNYIKLGTFPDEPLPPGIVNSSVPSKPKTNGIMDILSSSGKTVKRVLPDGNCFFRSLSFCFYGTDDHHLAVRKTVVDHIISDKKNYSTFLFHGSIDEHVIQMAKPCVWATQVELQAAADCYTRNIFTLTETPDRNGYHWILYKPQNDRKLKAGHIELAHFSSVHFEPVIDVLTRNLPQTPPQLQGGTSYDQKVL